MFWSKERFEDVMAQLSLVSADAAEAKRKVDALARHLGVMLVGPYAPTYTPAGYLVVSVVGKAKKK